MSNVSLNKFLPTALFLFFNSNIRINTRSFSWLSWPWRREDNGHRCGGREKASERHYGNEEEVSANRRRWSLKNFKGEFGEAFRLRRFTRLSSSRFFPSQMFRMHENCRQECQCQIICIGKKAIVYINNQSPGEAKRKKM